MEKPKSFKVMVRTTTDGPYATNALRFKTEEDAKQYGEDLFLRWTAVHDWHVEASDENPNR